ncbi:MAG: 4-alpha-glucanotransferase [Spirochaetaceae bacterium]|nr:4-alpha-glucanotransferase [Spirochaetaceae bacterium]
MKFAHPGKPLSGIAVSLSALRSRRSPACGEYPDLAALGELAEAWGLGLVQLLPVNDSGSHSSPYSALSAFALHPLYLSVADLPEAEGVGGAAYVAAAAELAARYAKDERLRYGPYLEAKLELLELVWTEAGAPRLAPGSPKYSAESKAFAAWLAANPWVKAYAVFSELKRREGGKPWWEWSSRRDPSAKEIEALWADPALVDGTRFRAWLQWRAEGQFAAAAASLAARGIELMGDIPILINEDSAEVWARRSVFRLGLAAGAPPDMYSYLGQNWGFPIYDWEALAKDDYSFWRERLASAEKFYSAYRIDHVLGFFRIWSLGEREREGYLGRFVPDAYVERAELEARGFSPERLRWLSEPHVRTDRLVAACGGEAGEAMEAALLALDRIGREELFLFKRSIRGEKDLEELAWEGVPGYGGKGLSARALDFLKSAWRDRVLYEFEPGRFVAAWRHAEASAWPSLSEDERRGLESLFGDKSRAGQRLWEETGRRLLGVLGESSPMLPCAEDLGSVPPCVPRVLEELGILGLRVLRWTRRWGEAGDPFVPLGAYPELSVACPSVHDSSSLREWWETEADREAVWRLAGEALGAEGRKGHDGRSLGPVPQRLDPGSARILLEALARSSSRFVVYPAQDLLALGEAFRPADPRAERVNVPGSTNDWNWGWRLPAAIEEIGADAELAAAVRGVAAARPS